LAGALIRPGVIRNPRSHRNRGEEADPPAGVRWAEPATPEALAIDLARFAAEGVDLLAIAGGDGTIRDVLSALPAAFGATPPVLAIIPAGKTNILALDLGAPVGWTLEEALGRAGANDPATKTRCPLEVSWADGALPPVRGFVFGMGAFVRATEMSRAVHRMGAFHTLAVGLTIAGAATGTMFGGKADQWRRGVEMTLGLDDAPRQSGAHFLTLATTLKRLPLGLAPFGPPHEGLKVLDVDAPPRKLLAALPALLRGSDAAWLTRAGYRRAEVERLRMTTTAPSVIDGEVFPGGEIVVRRCDPVRFLAP